MQQWQIILHIIFSCYCIYGLWMSSRHVFLKKNMFGLCPVLLPVGAFVWADGFILSIFWLLTSLVLLLLHNWYLSLLIYSLFWTVRSLGEIIYWLNEQFSPLRRNPPHTLFLYRFFPNDSVWFVMQLLWQCILVLFLLTDILLIKHLISQ